MSSHLFRVTEHVVPAQHIREYPGATSRNQNETLEICLKQYTPLEYVDAEPPEGAVTLIGTHANGFFKELYEPLWDDILQQSRGRFHIRGIWMADVMNQGDSYVRNESRLGNDPSWFDSSRDLLHIINHFRKDMPRPIVGIGHSFGAASLVNLALFHPRLFASLILVDPVIVATSPGTTVPGVSNPWGVIYLSAFRRDIWPSRDAAREAFRRNPFYRGWDPRVFDKLMEYGFVEVPTALYPNIEAARVAATNGDKKNSSSPSEKRSDSSNSPIHRPGSERPITLKTTKHQEVLTFVRANFFSVDKTGRRIYRPRTHPDSNPGMGKDYPFYRPEPKEVFRRLPSLRPPTFYILGERSNISPPNERREKVMLTGIGIGGNGGEAMNQDGTVPGLAGLGTKEITLKKVGHLVPMEATKKTAELCTEWMVCVVERWQVDEREYQAEMNARAPRENLVLGKSVESVIERVQPGERVPDGLLPQSKARL